MPPTSADTHRIEHIVIAKRPSSQLIVGLLPRADDKRPLVIDNLRFRAVRATAQHAEARSILGGEGGFCRAAGQHGAFHHHRIIANSLTDPRLWVETSMVQPSSRSSRS